MSIYLHFSYFSQGMGGDHCRKSSIMPLNIFVNIGGLFFLL